MAFKYLTLSLALAGLSGVAAAADDTFLDGRLNLGIVPGIKSADYSGGGASGTDTTSAKEGFGVGLGVEYGQYLDKQFGWVAGASLIEGSAKGDASGNGNSELKETHYGVQINAGAAFKVNKEIHIELTPFVGIGRAKTTVVGANDGSDASASGTFFDYGITLAGFYTFNDHWQGGLDIGYEGYKAKSSPSINFGAGSTTVDVTAKGSGLIAGLSLGYRF
jgi:hypothetical protein